MILSKFAERLGDFMDDSTDNGLTLADKLGCGRNTIYRYLQANRMPSVSMTVLIADYFRCTTDFLLGLEDVNYSCNFPPCPAFKDRFPLLLQECGISQYKLEKMTKISHSLMGYWKSGTKKPSLYNIIKIAKALDCSVDFVLGRTKL